MKLTITEGEHKFEQIYLEVKIKDIEDMVNAFMKIYKLQTCEWKLEGEGFFGQLDTP